MSNPALKNSPFPKTPGVLEAAAEEGPGAPDEQKEHREEASERPGSSRSAPQAVRKHTLFPTTTLLTLTTIALVLFIWYFIARLRLVSDLFVPSPRAVWDAFVEVSVDGYRGQTLLSHLEISLIRVLAGFSMACVTAIPLGLAMGANRHIRAVFDPLVEFYRPLPPLAYYTILVIWMGIGDESKIALLYLAAFPPLCISAMAGVRGVGLERIDGARSLGANRWQVFRHVIFPSCLPDIFTGMRVSIGFTYTTLVAAEIVAATSGVGWMVLDASKFLRSDVIFMGIIVMGITGILLDRIIRWAETRIVPWKGKY